MSHKVVVFYVDVKIPGCVLTMLNKSGFVWAKINMFSLCSIHCVAIRQVPVIAHSLGCCADFLMNRRIDTRG